MPYLIGADPELFVQRLGHGIISGHAFPCGTKKMPRKTAHGSVQVDGVALEFNVTPAADRIEFIANVHGAKQDLLEIVRQYDKSCVLVATPTANFTPEYMATLPAAALELGCEPDYNAYTGMMNQKPDGAATFRTGAGHVHIGWTEGKDVDRDDEHFEKCCAIVRQMDFFLGLPSLKWDRDNERRKLYGKAGAFRPKHYGVEYRSLSNAWLSSPEDWLVGFVFDQAQRGLNAFDKGNNLYVRYRNAAEIAINRGDATWDYAMPQVAKALEA